MIGNGTLYGNLYRLELYSLFSFSPTINTISSTKRLRLNENPSILWHKHLGHISKQRMVSIMVDMTRQDATLDHLRSTFKNVALMLNIQFLVLLNRMGLWRGGIHAS